MCSSALELSLHLGISMSNAHMHRPFPRCMYTFIRLYASIVRARACVCVCVCVHGGALHACKLRRSVDILAKSVIWRCKDVIVSLRMFGSPMLTLHRCIRAHVCGHELLRACVCVRVVRVCASLATHVFDIEIYVL